MSGCGAGRHSGCDVDDTAEAALAHRRHGRLNQPHGRKHIGLIKSEPGLRRCLEPRRGRIRAGVVDQNIDAAKGRCGFGENAAGAFIRRQIPGHAGRFRARDAYDADHRTHPGGIATVDEDAGAFARERARDLGAETCRTSGDKRRVFGQFKVHCAGLIGSSQDVRRSALWKAASETAVRRLEDSRTLPR
jgi:hypothetical protein